MTNLKRPKNPCHYCDDRSATCRLNCTEWKEYEEARNEFYKQQRKQSELNTIWADVLTRQKDRALRAKRRRK